VAINIIDVNKEKLTQNKKENGFIIASEIE